MVGPVRLDACSDFSWPGVVISMESGGNPPHRSNCCRERVKQALRDEKCLADPCSHVLAQGPLLTAASREYTETHASTRRRISAAAAGAASHQACAQGRELVKQHLLAGGLHLFLNSIWIKCSQRLSKRRCERHLFNSLESHVRQHIEEDDEQEQEEVQKRDEVRI